VNTRRLVIVLSILLTGYLYLAFRWLGSIGLHGLVQISAWTLLLLPFASFIWLFVVFFQREEEETEDSYSASAIAWIVFSSIGLVSFLFTFTLMRDLLSLFFWIAGKHSLNTPSSFWMIGAATLLSFIVGALLARFGLHTTHVTIPIENLPHEFEGFTIAQISDLHIGATLSAAFVKRVVRRVNNLKPDCIALTGDIVDAYYKNAKEKTSYLAELQARDGRYYITGNHEYYWGADDTIKGFEKLGFTVLINGGKTISRGRASLLIAGVPDYMSTHTGGPKPDPALPLEGVAQNTVKILLAHQPSFAQAASKAGYDLQLSGHTHGGQFFPWTLVVRFFHRFYRGLDRLEKTWVYVNRGTGYWGPPIRLGSRPEISLLKLVKADLKS